MKCAFSYKKILSILLFALLFVHVQSVLGAGGIFQPENTFVDSSVESNNEIFSPVDSVVDSVNHRLFVTDSSNNRVLVFDLDTNDQIVDRTADYVIGQLNMNGSAPGVTPRKFNSPTFLEFDPVNQFLFVSDTNNNRVLVFDVSDLTPPVSAFMAFGQPNLTSSATGITDTKMDAPRQLSFDSFNGRLFVADTGNHRISVFDVSVLDDHTPSGPVYVNHLGTPALSGTTNALLSGPGGVFYEQKDKRLYVADSDNNRVLVFDLDTLVDEEPAVNVLGQIDFTSGGSGISSSAFEYPYGVWGDYADGAYLYVADTSNNRVLKFDTTSITNNEPAINVLGQIDFAGEDSNITPSGLTGPTNARVFNESDLYVADGNASRLLVYDVSTPISDGQSAYDGLGQIDSNGEMDFTATSSATILLYSFGQNMSSVTDTNNHRLFVSDYGNNRVLVFDLDSNDELIDEVPDYVLGHSSFSEVGPGVTDQDMSGPLGLAFDSTTNRLFVSDSDNSRVLVFDVSTVSTYQQAIHVLGPADFFTDTGALSQSEMSFPELGLQIDESKQLLYVGDSNNGRILVFDVATITDGEDAVHVLGQPDFNSNEGLTDEDSLSYPRGLALDVVHQRLFTTDNASRVLVFDVATITDGEDAVRVLGQIDFTGTSGSTTSATFTSASGLAYDSDRDVLYVADNTSNRVIVFDVTAITDGEDAIGILGQEDFVTSSSTDEVDGFATPEGLYFDRGNQRLYVDDSGNVRNSYFDFITLSTASIDSDAPVGQPYSQSFTIENQQGTVGMELVSGALPTGLSFAGSALSGTPTLAGSYTFSVRATDTVTPGIFYSDTRSYSITVSAGSSGGGGSSGYSPRECNDGRDNDGDGMTDYPSDLGCTSYTDDSEINGSVPSLFACNDAGDNDNDGFVDLVDPGCASPFDNDESNQDSSLSQCNDGVDNDADGKIDFRTGQGGDPGCLSPFDSSEINGNSGSDDDPQEDPEEVSGGEDEVDGGQGSIDPDIEHEEDGGEVDEGNNDVPIDDGSTGPIVRGVVERCDFELPPNASVLDVAGNEIVRTFCIARETVRDTFPKINFILNASNSNPLAQIIALVGLVMGALFTLTPTLFLNPFSFTEVVFIPYRITSLILNAFGFKKRNRPWGTVYDSVTKQPLDPVMVSLYDMTGNEVATSITDMDGRYGFLVAPGMYKMIAKKTHYQFPSIKLAGKTRDELYVDLYYGTTIEVRSKGDVLIKNIPMDPIGFDWNEFAKRDQKLLRFFSRRDVILARISDALFGIGFMFSLLALMTTPTLYNIVIFATYIFFIVIRETGVTRKSFGSVKTQEGTPLPFAIIRVFTTESHTEVSHKVTNEQGKYFCLIQNGRYYFTVERKNPDESYTIVYTSSELLVTNGLIQERVTVR